MTRAFKSLMLAVVSAAFLSSIAPTGAATNQAVLTVKASVTNKCDVLTEPATLNMSYDPVQNVATFGTSSFTYACTDTASVSVTPTSSINQSVSKLWSAEGCAGCAAGPYILHYYLYNALTCTSGQLSNGTNQNLGSGTGSPQRYSICAIPLLGQQLNPATTYSDTVTFSFNFGP